MPDITRCRDHFYLWLRAQGMQQPAVLGGWVDDSRLRQLQRDEFLLHAGEQQNFLYFLDQGLLRYVYTSPVGKERNKAFFAGPQLVGAASAAISGCEAPFSIQALEDSTLLALPFDGLRRATHTEPEVAQLMISLLAAGFIRNEQREAMLLTCNAEQRYRWLQRHEPELLERLPQHHLASYIGVDAVSLSRLKRKLLATG